jgi:hypothetical protein
MAPELNQSALENGLRAGGHHDWQQPPLAEVEFTPRTGLELTTLYTSKFVAAG